jgi:hypothetical protein
MSPGLYLTRPELEAIHASLTTAADKFARYAKVYRKRRATWEARESRYYAIAAKVHEAWRQAPGGSNECV